MLVGGYCCVCVHVRGVLVADCCFACVLFVVCCLLCVVGCELSVVL